MKAYPSYKEYKPSNVDWLGEIPEHWDCWKISHGYSEMGSGTTPTSDNDAYYDGNINWVTTSELRENIIVDTAKKVSQDAMRDFSALKKYPSETLLIAMYGATIGRLGILGVEATINQACCALVKSKVFFNPFLFYWFQAYKKTVIILASGGGQPNISQEKIRSLILPTPPFYEQQMIADFLDRETAKIDSLIKKRNDLIKLLQEKRSAVISHAVTKGIDPTVRLKPSNVYWLGEIPEHWKVIPLKYLLCEKLKYGANELAIDEDETQPRFVRITDISDDGTLRPDTFKSIDIQVAKEYLLAENDLLFARSGATVGKTFLYQKSWGVTAFAGYLIRARFSLHKANSKFIFFCTRSSFYWQWIKAATIQATIQNVSAEKYASFCFPLPSLPEQQKIADFLDRETAKIDSLIEKEKKIIEKMKEYRTALISAAVTGKIDVRGEVAHE